MRALGAAPVADGDSLAAVLTLGSRVSLWDAIAPVLLLYRFPLLFQQGGAPTGMLSPQRVWAYRGWVASRIDAVRQPARTADGCAAWPGGPVALFLAFSDLFHRDVLKPVIRRVNERRRFAAVSVGLGGGAPQSVWTHWTAAVQQRAADLRGAFGRVRAALRSRRAETELRRAAAGVSWPALRAELDRVFWREFPALVAHLAVAEHVLDTHPVSVIVSPDNADPRCRLYLIPGRRQGIPALIVQQGLVGRGYPDWKFLEADRVAVMGRTSMDLIAEQGVPADRMELTGHPGFDVLAAADADERASLRARLGVPAGRALVVFASQPYLPGAFPSPAVRTTLLQNIAAAAAGLPGVAFVVKPHPSENTRELARLFHGTPVTIVGRTIDIRPLIRSADVFVTFFSTSALQALVAGTPVITLIWPGGEAANMYATAGASWVARSPAELRDLVGALAGSERHARMDEKRDAVARFVHDWAHAADGGAAARVAGAIETLAGVAAR